MQLFGGNESDSFLVPMLGVGLLVTAFVINILGNRFIGTMSMVNAIIKIGGVIIFATVRLWVSGFALKGFGVSEQSTAGNFLAATALALLAYKGFTTITNSGAEIMNPKKNIGRSIILSLTICAVVYFVVAMAVASSLTVSEIVKARGFALAEAARPALGTFGTYFTVGLAIVATVSGLIASTFAVSRMLAMLTEMNLVPHSHFGMPGTIQQHTLVCTVVFAITLTLLFDLSRIASLGAIL